MPTNPNKQGNQSSPNVQEDTSLKPDSSPQRQIWCAQVITLFPQAFPGVLGESVIGKALSKSLWQLYTLNLRLFGEGRHLNVDDTPAGGGAGMILRADVMGRAIDAALERAKPEMPLVYLSPRGKRFDQMMAHEWAHSPGVTLLCGRFEGVDQRVVEHYGMEEVSLGDFIMTGGEIAAQAMLDATVRLLPGVLGNQTSINEESFSEGLIEHPQYTRPLEWKNHLIPDVLLSGHHGEIKKWRKKMSKEVTRKKRPDLLK